MISPARTHLPGFSCALLTLLSATASANSAVGFQNEAAVMPPVAERRAVVVGERRLNPTLFALASGRWIKIHDQRSGDALTFKRQAHAGSAFDSKRGRIIIFGSDTHGKDWSNSPLFFDLANLKWSRLYPDDDLSTYKVNSQGIAVAGSNGNHPWAMHTFGSVEYDPIGDALVVSSYPQHLEPGRFTDVLAEVWPQIRRHPTWILDLETGKWQTLPGESEHFFPYATAYDSDRHVIIGYKSSGIFELHLHSARWKRITSRGLLGYHNNAGYDSWHKSLVVFGSNRNSSDVIVYNPATRKHLKMATAGQRPPRDQHTPMAFHERLGKTVVLVDQAPDGRRTRDLNKMRAETWLYDLGNDEWTQVSGATLPFGGGMNYNMEYDPAHDLVLLVANPPGKPTAVWALRL